MKTSRLFGLRRRICQCSQFEPQIGFNYTKGKLSAFAFCQIAFLIILVDIGGRMIYEYEWSLGIRFLLMIPFIILYIILGRKGLGQFGLRIKPHKGWSYWFKILVMLSFVMGILIVLFFLVSNMLGYDNDIRNLALPPHIFWNSFIYACFYAVIVEEFIYRFLFCIPLVNVIGKWWTITLNGIIFALLHIIYGNPGVDNFVAGFILSWAFIQSGTILIPIFFHFIGNLAALLIYMLIYFFI